MKRSKQFFSILVAAIFIVGSLAVVNQATAKGSPQEKCPVMGGTINKDIYVDYQGKRIYFCCEACPKEFNKDPDKYMKKLKEQGVTLEDAPKTQ